MKKIFSEIIASAIKQNADPVEWILDYMHEKDSHISRTQAEWIVAKYQNVKDEG